MERVFNVRVERDRESGWLVGTVLELPGCYTQAPDLDALHASAIEAIELYLETTADDDATPTEYVETFEVAVPA